MLLEGSDFNLLGSSLSNFGFNLIPGLGERKRQSIGSRNKIYENRT